MKERWWKEDVVYQIYPRSFNDSNGDGIGDIPGIIAKVDYLDKLGVDVVWLNPVYESPNDDNGYDISDYRSIMDDFGTMDDWEKLLEELHKRDIKLIMDLVVNHTSDEHAWFVESRSSKDNKYRDYYIWREGEEGEPPNNWESFFSGSAWDYDEKTEEYYLHLFSKKQPDLNWRNEEVRESIYEMMSWWLDKGIDGFRMDVINLISKAEGLPDSDGSDGLNGAEYFANGPKVHDYLQEMNQKVLSNYDIMTVGELPMVEPEDGVKYVAEDRNELNTLFHFEHMGVDSGEYGKWCLNDFELKDLKRIISKWQNGLHEKGWNSNYLSNHDQPRHVSRFGDDDEYRVESAKMLASFIHTLQGTPYIYQGEEIGMTNVPFNNIDEFDDVETINFYNQQLESGNIEDMDEFMEILKTNSRDNSRTPIQWDDSENAGFTTGEPWIKINPNYKEINVAQALEDENSIFYYYQKLIELRKEHSVFVYGDYKLLLEDDEEIYAYIREYQGEKLLVILNFFAGKPKFELPANISYKNKELLLSNYEVESDDLKEFNLRAYEARIYLLK